MLNQLLKLYKKHSQKTPLEDFTTEAFVGLLCLEENIKSKFITDFLHLPEGNYTLKTQVHYALKDDTDCIVDFVLESENTICFIENKVDSKEGKRQLERYGKVLSIYRDDDYETKLVYCTKYFDKKSYQNHNFLPIRWFEIAKYLKQFNNCTLAIEFNNFLKINNMAQELTFSAQDFLTFENIQNIINSTINYLDRVKPIFISTFKTESKISDGITTNQIVKHNRLIYYYKDVIGNGGWSELKYGFILNQPMIYVGIWVDKSNDNYTALSKLMENTTQEFTIVKIDKGISIELRLDISTMLNDKHSDTKITDWFKESFIQFDNFIKTSATTLKWKTNNVA